MRELENAIERAVVVCRGDHDRRRRLPPTVVPADRAHDGAPPIPGATLDRARALRHPEDAGATGGSTSRAAEILGISPRKIQYKLHEYQGVAREPSEA